MFACPSGMGGFRATNDDEICRRSKLLNRISPSGVVGPVRGAVRRLRTRPSLRVAAAACAMVGGIATVTAGGAGGVATPLEHPYPSSIQCTERSDGGLACSSQATEGAESYVLVREVTASSQGNYQSWVLGADAANASSDTGDFITCGFAELTRLDCNILPALPPSPTDDGVYERVK